MLLKLMQVGEPVLRREARSLTPEEIRSQELQRLIESMRETMLDAPGVGLAAPQIGLQLRLAVIEDRAEYQEHIPEQLLVDRQRRPVPFHAIINPEIEVIGSDKAVFFEGCLSLEGFTALVPRAMEVRVKCLNEKAEPVTINARGWYARILQHEIDHLKGGIYIDHMESRSLMTIENYNRYWDRKTVSEVRSELGLD